MKAIKTFIVTYDKKNGQTGILLISAPNEKQALNNAKNCCFTGRNFRDAIETDEKYVSPSKVGFQGSNRQN
jgi:hypothetical protein